MSAANADTDEVSICIGCGLCCDGTVVTHLAVRDESDLGAPLRGLGVEILVAADPPVFELPCPALHAGCCSIHSLHRPSACAQFECSLSRAYLDGLISLEEAKAEIAHTFELRLRLDRGEIGTEEFTRHIERTFRAKSSFTA